MKIIITIEMDEKESNPSKEVKTGSTSYSQYAKVFDETSVHWDANPHKNIMFLACQQRYANDLLKTKGHVFLNEVYDMLGMPRTAAGQIVGWVLDENDPFCDKKIIFDGIDDPDMDGKFAIDFNVDGDILDRI